MSSKRLSLSLNKQERMILGDVCSITGEKDRSKVIREAAMMTLNRFLQQVTEQRMKQREELAKKQEAKDNAGDADADSTTPRDSSDSDSDLLADAEGTVVDAEGGQESSAQA